MVPLSGRPNCSAFETFFYFWAPLFPVRESRGPSVYPRKASLLPLIAQAYPVDARPEHVPDEGRLLLVGDGSEVAAPLLTLILRRSVVPLIAPQDVLEQASFVEAHQEWRDAGINFW